MPRKKDLSLNIQAKEIIYKTYCFFEKEAEDGSCDLRQVQRRTARATETSIATVRRISVEGRGKTEFKTPGKKRRLQAKRVTGLHNFHLGIIKRCIHNFYDTEKVIPTTIKLQKKLQNEIKFVGSECSLRRIIKSLGFMFKRVESKRQVLMIEKINIRLKRIEFLESLKRYRQEGRPIVYTDETYIDLPYSAAKIWFTDPTMGLKSTTSKGQRVIMLHAGSETGFLSNALLTYEDVVKMGDCSDTLISFDTYEKWLLTNLIPNLPEKSVVVLDHALYHKKQCDLAPTPYAKRSDMKAWLTKKGINYTENMSKPELFNLIKTHKEHYKIFKVDKILEENNHDVLWLPPCDPDLNPMEMALSAIKGYVNIKTTAWSVQGVIDLIKEELYLMDISEWNDLCQKVRGVEAEYWESDKVVDMMTEEFNWWSDDDDSDSDSDISDDDDEDDGEEATTSSIAKRIKYESD